MMFVYNPEGKRFFIKYIGLFIISIIISLGMSFISLNVVKNKVVENNQIIIGDILVKYPELEKDIVDIITQGRHSNNKTLGENVLNKYNYNSSIKLQSEPIISQSMKAIISNNIILVIVVFISVLGILIIYFNQIYKDIKDMTDYVYHKSEGRNFEMKNKNQEGQIGLLKTELLKMTNILREHIELLKKEKIFLNDTISDISHQLKTPMTSLVLLNDIMYDDLPKEVKIDFLDKIKSQLNRMEWLIKSMLKLSKVEAKVIDFKKEEINIKELIHKAIEPVKMSIDMKDIKLRIDGENDIKFYGDMNWCTEAFVNIIKNCVEHTPNEGNIQITYKENPLFSEIIIKDSGEGIDKDEIPKIFERFYKGKNSTKEDSVGIGLAMAKSIIENQNGDIFVKSEKNKGTEFHISIHKSYCD